MPLICASAILAGLSLGAAAPSVAATSITDPTKHAAAPITGNLQWVGAQTYGRGRWTVGVVSADLEPWQGERRFALRRRVPAEDVSRVMADLANDAESGRLRIPPRKRLRRR